MGESLPPVGTIPDLVRASARRFAELSAVEDARSRFSFVELDRQMDQVAKAMVAQGVTPGDRVGLWAPNSSLWIVTALGILAAGGVLVPLNTRFKGAEAGYILRTSGAKLLVAADQMLGVRLVDLLRADGGQLPDLAGVVLMGEGAEAGDLGWKDFVASGDCVKDTVIEERMASLEPEDLSDVIFTSGTTGQPKGVMLTHGQSLRVYTAWTEIVGLRQGDRYLIVYPFFHSAGYKSGWLSCILRGATALPEAVFDVRSILKRVEREHITVLPGPPTVLQDILDFPARDEFDLSSLRLTITGAAVVPVELVRRLRAEMSFETIITGYGLTETCGTVAMCRHDDDPETIAHWSGRALPDTELAIMDDLGALAAPGTPGEVVTRGYHLMKGYFDDPEATAATIDDQGWLHTGDIGIMDHRGYVRITDRKKDMYIVGGFNAYPAEIEGLVLRNDLVSQVAVVGVPDDRMGEVGFAFVVPRPGRNVDPQALREWCRDYMANYKVPRHVRVVDRLPVNPTGKVLKYALRDRARAEVLAGKGRG